MLTGSDYYIRLQNAIDKTYSDYLQIDEAQMLLDFTYYRIIEKVYRGLMSQKQSDEISVLIVTDKSIPVINGVVHTLPMQISNVVANGTVVEITTQLPHHVSVGDTVTISGVTGITVTNINITAVVTIVNSDTTFTYDSGGSVMTGYNAGTGQVVTDNMLEDYYHYFYSRARVIDTTTSKTVSGVTTGAVTTTLTVTGHRFRTGDLLYIPTLTGVTLTDTSAYYTITVTGRNTFTINTGSSGTYSGSNTATIAYYNECTPYLSDRKGSNFGQPTKQEPRFSTAELLLKYYPAEVNNVEVDYMRRPPIEIDLDDNNVNIELYYSKKFLGLIQDEFVASFSAETRDPGRYNTSLQQEQMNP